ncbi:MAG: efflux transporter outer membrane subunit [Planctomycetes bacterium]|nr:efflux transporter outer membrane subunit [Planctomycetota bacterium]
MDTRSDRRGAQRRPKLCTAERPAPALPRRAPAGAALIALALALALAPACRLHKVNPEPDPEVALPEAFSRTGDSRPPVEQWWREFGDEDLDRLVDRALSGNFDLKAAWARLEQAEAVVRRTRASLFPVLSAEGSASRTRQTFSVGGPVGTVTNESSQFVLSVAASYEVDLWGRIASQWDAADLDATASRDDCESMAMTIAARVAETWYQLGELRAQRDLIDEQLGVSRIYLELLELRFGQGLASALDVYQQRQQVGSLEAQVPPLESATAVLEHQLAVILGRAPTEEVAPERSSMPDLPALPPTGVPGELIVRRPDLRAARARAVAADHRLASAIADLLPAIRLSGRTGYQAPDISDVLDRWLWNIAGSISAPLFEGGRRKAEVERARAVVKERLHGFAATLLVAVREVEDALVQEQKQEERIAALDRQVDVARASLREARSRYINGLVDYLNVLTALSLHQNLERERLRSQRELISIRIQLCRALGGSWTRDLQDAGEVALKTGDNG